MNILDSFFKIKKKNYLTGNKLLKQIRLVFIFEIITLLESEPVWPLGNPRRSSKVRRSGDSSILLINKEHEIASIINID